MILLKKSWPAVLSAGLLLALAGCGGGTDRTMGAGGNGNGNGAIGANDDSFIAQVRAVVALDGNSPDVLPYDSIKATMPEDSEPVAI